MTQSELVVAVAAQSNITQKQAKEVLEAAWTAITAELNAGGEIKLGSIGTLKAATAKARSARNPQTGETLQIPERRKVTFKMASTMKALLQGSPATE